ncbi:DNA-binding response OmpR family regulator [Bradyrhizobium sp. USDA 10063]
MTQSPHIIIVDDEAPAREMVGDYLKMHGFGVTLCDGGKSLRSVIETNHPDLVVLDLNMPEEDGLSIIRDLKSRMNVPVIMLTATASPIDRVVGLELGADDYVAKPCELRELMARIRSVLRRSTPARTAAPEAAAAKTEKEQLVRFGTKWLDLQAQALRDDEGNEHPLTALRIRALEGVCGQPETGAFARAAARTGQCARCRGIRPRRRPPDHAHPPQDRDRSDQARRHPHHPRRRLSVLTERRKSLIFVHSPMMDARERTRGRFRSALSVTSPQFSTY